MGEIWWGLWPSVKFKSKTFALKGVERVEIDRILKYKDSSKSRRPCYPVILAGGPEEIEFSKSFQYLESRRIAEAIAGFWEVPLHDRSEGTLVVREPDRLNESLAAQASHRREKPDTLPEPPAEMLSSLEDDGRTLVIEIPLMGFIVFHKIAVLAIMGVFGIITLFQYLTGTLIVVNPPGVNALLLPLIDPVNIISFLGIFFVFQHASERTIITADRQGLLIRKKGMISRTVVKMKAELMEEFFAAAWLTERSARDHGRESLKNMLGLFKKFAKSHSCLIARNDRKVASVTIPVPQAEAEYIAALVTARLSGVK
ncbi:MAG: hypothetical protein HZB23_00285 [Deltaproteobacteria bacterium]|nr:hypothetical protein [Deltaproteobacteria bacterium]